MSAWKPGDVAMVRYGVRPVHEDIAVRNGTNSGWSGPFVEIADADNYLHDARPLVVIDPEDAEQVERLAVIYDAVTERCFPGQYPDLPSIDPADDTAVLQEALREYANPTPRIEEPMGLGAVVEDGRGRRFVRQWTIPDPDGQAWRQENGHGLIAWCDFDPVRVLSHGVTEEAS